MRKSWLVICLFNFVVAALMGLFLRLTKVVAVDIEYSHLLHAHSHTAMLGWAYMMVFALAVHYFVPEGQRAKYNRNRDDGGVSAAGLWPVLHHIFDAPHHLQLLVRGENLQGYAPLAGCRKKATPYRALLHGLFHIGGMGAGTHRDLDWEGFANVQVGDPVFPAFSV